MYKFLVDNYAKARSGHIPGIRLISSDLFLSLIHHLLISSGSVTLASAEDELPMSAALNFPNSHFLSWLWVRLGGVGGGCGNVGRGEGGDGGGCGGGGGGVGIGWCVVGV